MLFVGDDSTRFARTRLRDVESSPIPCGASSAGLKESRRRDRRIGILEPLNHPGDRAPPPGVPDELVWSDAKNNAIGLFRALETRYAAA